MPTPSAKLKASRAPRTSNLNLRHQTKQKYTCAEQATQKKKPKLALREGRTHLPEVEETVQEGQMLHQATQAENQPSTSDEANCA